MPTNVNALVALGGGLLSFFSPCVLPLVPAYLGYLSGISVTTEEGELPRARMFLHALAFVLGFSVVFVLLGASAGALGYLFYDLMSWIQRIGGILIIVFGLHVMGLLKIPILYQEKRLGHFVGSRFGYGSSFLAGVFFSAGWTPCFGPILGAVLLLAGNTATAARGAFLLSVYSLGLGIPFLITGAAFSAISPVLRRLNRYLGIVSLVSGIFLVVLGFLLFTDMLRVVSGLLEKSL